VQVLVTYIKVHVVQLVLLDTILILPITLAMVNFSRLFIHEDFCSNVSKLVIPLAQRAHPTHPTLVPHVFLATFYMQAHAQPPVPRNTIPTQLTTLVKVSFCRIFK
jgi:hypothetical protein